MTADAVDRRAAALGLRRELIALLREHADSLALPPGASGDDVHAEIARRDAADDVADADRPLERLESEIKALAAVLFTCRAPQRPLLERLRAHPFFMPIPGGVVRVDFEHFRDLDTVARGAWEPRNLAFMCRSLRPGNVVLDIGAHVGHFTIPAASFVAGGSGGGRIIAFEPAPPNLVRLRRNVALSQPRATVEIVPAAVGACPGSAKVFDDGDSGGTEFSLHSGRHGVRVAFEAAVETIDRACAARGITAVDFVKIDAEGAELEILIGGDITLRASRPVTLLIELHPWVVEPARVVHHLFAAGFRVADVKAPDQWLVGDAAVARFERGGDLVAASGD